MSFSRSPRGKPEPPSVGFSAKCGNHARGGWAEMIVAADLIRRGFEVFLGAHGGTSCDILALFDGKVTRIEVKLGQWTGSSFSVSIDAKRRASFDVLAIVTPDGTAILYRPELPSTP